MAAKSSIEWTELTWNPVTGCNKVSAGCKFCYAERMAKRLQAMGVDQYKNGFKLSLAPQTLSMPYNWKKPKIIFVNSMSDLFHKDVPLEYIQRVFKVMNETPQHIYQILTKRPERLLELDKELLWSKNIWMGVSVENEKVNYRIDLLKKCSSNVKFISFEPLIGSVGKVNLKKIDWVIVGGESGPGARKIEKKWIIEIFKEARKVGASFFFKQWGKKEFNVNLNDPTMNKKHQNYAKGGCLLDGKAYREIPQFG